MKSNIVIKSFPTVTTLTNHADYSNIIEFKDHKLKKTRYFQFKKGTTKQDFLLAMSYIIKIEFNYKYYYVLSINEMNVWNHETPSDMSHIGTLDDYFLSNNSFVIFPLKYNKRIL